MPALSWRRPALALLGAFVSLVVIDALAAVGRTAGQASVGSTGAAQYSIPLWTPPGTNGLQPSLALVYSSSSGNGLLGMGWSIAGLSSITRCNQTPAQDGAWNAAGLSSTDKLCLDGSRLRLVTGTQGAAGSTYRTEIETFSLVTANGTQGNGPAWFEVKTKDGLIYEYGHSSSSFIEALASGGGQVPSARAWALSRIKDRSDNYIEFFYTEDTTNGGYRPQEIQWTGNVAGAPPQYRVVFVYESVARPDTIWGYRFGDSAGVDGKQNETKRLDRIDVCFGAGTAGTACTLVVRSYDVAYEVSGGAGSRSRIDWIQEYGPGGTDSLPKTEVTWIDGTPSWTAAETNTGQSVPSGVTPMIMDISGDGRDDVVWSTSTGSGSWAYMLANSSGGFDTMVNTGISNTGFAQALPIQWNGDDKWDLLVPYASNIWHVLLANGSGFAAPSSTGVSSVGMFWVADVNGDNRGDLLRGANSAAGATGYCQIWIRLNSATGFQAEPPSPNYQCLPRTKLNGTAPFGLPEYKWRSAERRPDFNGDNQEDVVVALIETSPELPTTTYVRMLTSGVNWFYESQNGVNSTSHWRFGDLNGDGLTDMLVRSSAGSMRFSFSRGEAMASWVSTNVAIDSSSLLTDWDSDGLADYMIASGSPVTWRYARSTGSGLAAMVDSGLAASTTPMAATADFTGDGLHDLIRADGTLKHRAHLGVMPDLLDRVTDGFGVYVDFNYAPLTVGGSFYVKGTSAAYPVRDYQGSMHVVHSYTASNGIGSFYTQTFAWVGARIDQTGRGFLGFQTKYEIDGRTGIVNSWDFKQDFPYIGMAWYVLQRQSDWATKIREETNTLANIPYPPAPPAESRWFPYVDRQEIKNYEVNVGGTNNGAHVSTVATDIATMDAWGTVTDVTTTTTQVGTGEPAFAGSTQTQRIEHPLVLNDFSPGSWCLSRPKQTRLTNAHSLNSGASVTRSIDHEWDASKCRMTQEVIEPGSASLKVTTEFQYGPSYGNPTQITVTPVNQPGRVTQMIWAPNGQFLDSVTNPASHVTDYDWYADRGLLLRITDPNTLQTTFEYDEFAREKEQTLPDGTAVHTEYKSCTTDPDCTSMSNVEYKVESSLKTGAGAIITQSFAVFDDFGRPRRESRFDLDGATSDILTEYRAEGSIDRVSQPHFGGSASPVWTTFSHDMLGRVTQESRSVTNDFVASAYTVSHVFEGLVQKSTDAEGKLTTRTLSAWGDVMKVVDHDGKQVSYEWDAFGNLKKTTDHAGNVATMNYNVRGMKTSSSDPDMGNWSYDYFPMGELKTQTDANGRTVTFDPYDPLGRPTKRYELEGETTWAWGNDSVARNKGQLASVIAPGWQESYQFEPVAGRPWKTTTTIDGIGHTFTNGYNATTGFLETIEYPASFGTALKLKYDYETANKSGLLEKVSDFYTPSTVFWEALSTDAFLQHKHFKLGGDSGAETSNTFDSVTGALNDTETTDGASVVQSFEYRRNKVGNLTLRTDQRQAGLSESFEYDNLHRLKKATVSGQPQQDFTYDANGLGNLLTKTGTGTYDYTAVVGGCSYYGHSQPHAVRQITGATSQSFCYDANGNMVKRNGATISWYSFNLPLTINQADGMYATFYYGANRTRYKQVALAYDAPGTVQRTTVYVGDSFEQVTESGVNTFKHYIRANGDVIAVQLRNSLDTFTRYLYEDHLQSTEVIAHSSGAALGHFSFDAWGMRRDRDWIGPITAADKLIAWQNTNRAFTSHEQLDNLGLVHMNGRVYDPGIGRFISADPFVMDAFNLQALNRYSYVLNNPLSFFDPSGFTPQVPGDDDDPFPSDDCGYDIFCSPPGGGFRFPTDRRPIFTPPFGVGPGEWESTDALLGAAGVGRSQINVRTTGGDSAGLIELDAATAFARELAELMSTEPIHLAQAGGGGRRRTTGGTRSGQRVVGPNASPVEQYIPGGSLQANERFPNAHVLSEHVGRSVPQLQARLAANPRLNIASSFRTPAEAEALIAEALAQAPIPRINVASGQWYQYGFRVELGRPTGVSVIPGAPATAIPTGVRIVLRHHPGSDTGYYIYSAYPD